MCGRFQLSVTGKHISERFDVEVFDEMYSPSYNCTPSQKLAVITNDTPAQLKFFKWGLIPFWSENPKIAFRLINARAESIKYKPSFEQAFLKRRCLIPANGFYEWKKGKTKVPYRIFLRDESLFAMAGLWEIWKNADGTPTQTFTIVTTKANELMEHIHQRMPVILSKKDEQTWLYESNQKALLTLLKPFDASLMQAYPISKKINSPRNNSPDVIVPILPENTLF